jgi:hypothetical protein
MMRLSFFFFSQRVTLFRLAIHPTSQPCDGVAGRQRIDTETRSLPIPPPITDEYNFGRQLLLLIYPVPVLAEFFPRDARLLGINVDMGARICVRLRPARDRDTLLSSEEVTGTLLHELVHCRIAPHNAAFYALLRELEDEHAADMVRSRFLVAGGSGKNELCGRARGCLVFFGFLVFCLEILRRLKNSRAHQKSYSS